MKRLLKSEKSISHLNLNWPYWLVPPNIEINSSNFIFSRLFLKVNISTLPSHGLSRAAAKKEKPSAEHYELQANHKTK